MKMKIYGMLAGVIACLTLTACEPEPDPNPIMGDDSYSKDIVGNWYGAYSTAAGRHWFDISFESDGSGTLTNDGPHSITTVKFFWNITSKGIEANGVAVTVDYDNESDPDTDMEWRDTFTLNKTDGKLYSSRYKLVKDGFKKIGVDYPDDEDTDENENENENEIPDAHSLFRPYLTYVPSKQYGSSDGKYMGVIEMRYGGSNMIASEVYEVGVNIEILNGYQGDWHGALSDSKTNISVPDNDTRYWTWNVTIYSTKDSPIKIMATEYWRFVGEGIVHYGAPKEITVPYDKTLDEYYSEEENITPQPGTTGYLNGHKWVDLGLSVKWADCNLGANAPEETGLLLMWGSVDPEESRENYWHNTYNELSNLYNIPGTKFDAATQMWGEGWRMPTSEEFKELMALFDYEYNLIFEEWPTEAQKFFSEINGVKVVKMWGKTGNYVSFPLKGYWTARRMSSFGSVYVASFDPYGAGFGSSGFQCVVDTWGIEDEKCCIRPVCDK